MIVFNTLLLGINLIAFALMLRRGGMPERCAVVLVLVSFALELVGQNLIVGRWRVGVAGVNLMLFLGLWLLAERWGRWWLVIAAGFQLVIVLTHLLPLITTENLINTGVIARKVVWLAISGVFFIAVWEAQADRRYRLERGTTKNA